jgi:hypothetical protein
MASDALQLNNWDFSLQIRDSLWRAAARIAILIDFLREGN